VPTRKQELRRKDEGAAARIHITDATFIFIDALTAQFTVFEGGEYITVMLRERNSYNLQELYDEMNHLTSFRKGDLVDLVVIPRRLDALKPEISYFLVSIKRS
jgi:hypothetical protein